MWRCGGRYADGGLLIPNSLKTQVGNVRIWSLLFFGNFAKCKKYSIIIAVKVSNTLWPFPKELLTLFRYCSNGLQELLQAFPKVSRHKFGHFLEIYFEAACLCLLSFFKNQ
jgi:hypothetical protein